MSRIVRLLFAEGRTGFYTDDQASIRAGAAQDGFFYDGPPLTPGFRHVRQAGESVVLQILLDDGQVAAGDCAAVQYSGAGGRDPLFRAADAIAVLERDIAPRLEGRAADRFLPLAREIEGLTPDGRPLHTALRYGLSHVLLDAVARATRRLPCEVLADEYGWPLVAEPVRIFCQSGDDRRVNADKMILKRADVLPHGLFNRVDGKVGRNGELLLDYIAWLRDRILARREDSSYQPDLHVDVYGTLGLIFDGDTGRIADYFARLARAAGPFALRVEGPIDLGSREAQCAGLANLRAELRRRGIPVGIVADEWCNTLDDTRLFADAGAADMIQVKTPDLGGLQNSVEAVRYCRDRGIGGYLGGTCNETDGSARMCVHAALACRPDQMLAKPGMGMDEGFMIVFNEMQRALTLLRARRGKPA